MHAAGFQALFAGGCVRDLLLDRSPKDWDVATDADPNQVASLFARTVLVGVKFGVVVVLLHGRQYEVARFRRDGFYLDGRRPEAVEFADARADAQRRDFTINAIAWHPLRDQLYDPFGGGADLNTRTLRTVGAAADRFREDYLRILRFFRFWGAYGRPPANANALAACRAHALPEVVEGAVDLEVVVAAVVVAVMCACSAPSRARAEGSD